MTGTSLPPPNSLFGPHKIEYFDDLNILAVNHRLLRFSPLQYRVLVILASGYPIRDTVLSQELYKCEVSSDVKRNIEKLVRKIRIQLQPVGLSIERVAKQAYVLLAIPE